jgi:hypothetical protein
MAPAQAQRSSPNAAHTSGTATATARTLGAGGGRQVRRPNLGGGARTRRHSGASGAAATARTLGAVEPPAAGAAEPRARWSASAAAPAQRQRHQRSGTSAAAPAQRHQRSGTSARRKSRASGAHWRRGGGHQGAVKAPGHGSRASGRWSASAARWRPPGRQPSLGPVERISRAVEATGAAAEPRARGAHQRRGWRPPGPGSRASGAVERISGAVEAPGPGSGAHRRIGNGTRARREARARLEGGSKARREARAGGAHQRRDRAHQGTSSEPAQQAGRHKMLRLIAMLCQQSPGQFNSL